MSEYVKIIVPLLPDNVKVVLQRQPDHVKVFIENIIERVVEIDPYIKTLSGFTDTINQAEHGLTIIRGLRVNKPTGELVEVAETYSGTTVTIDSNILLDNHTLIIY